MKKSVLLAGALLVPLHALPAMAQSLPRYDVKAGCREVASATGSYSEMIMSGCLQMEQSAYDSLKASWSSLTPDMRSSCHEVATATGSGSYSILQGCVQMETTSARRNAETEFKY